MHCRDGVTQGAGILANWGALGLLSRAVDGDEGVGGEDGVLDAGEGVGGGGASG
jgi:hypothetical protein